MQFFKGIILCFIKILGLEKLFFHQAIKKYSCINMLLLFNDGLGTPKPNFRVLNVPWKIFDHEISAFLEN